ncbi:hypothetical protein U9M48_031639 [Paspalum notatum var. saurae]|uniref:PA domain-containing protein n=1 Tax=Paspalum notatum var. saurae TaxID=547442 RepID=A0AAQ3X3K9_PASNO
MSPGVFLLLLAAALRPCAALVRLHSTSFSFTFLDAPARFGPRVGGDGICGSLRAADPVAACEPIKDRGGAGRKAFVLISRGNCSFEDKVRVAQHAGFDAAVVYDDEEKASLYSNAISILVSVFSTLWSLPSAATAMSSCSFLRAALRGHSRCFLSCRRQGRLLRSPPRLPPASAPASDDGVQNNRSALAGKEFSTGTEVNDVAGIGAWASWLH